MGYSTSGSTCSSMGSPWTTVPSGHAHLPIVILSCSVDACSSVISCRENLCSDTWNICSLTLVSAGLFFTAFHSLLTDCAAFCPFSHGPFLGHCHCGCRVQLCLVVGPVELEVAVLSTVPATPQQGHLAAPPPAPCTLLQPQFQCS